MFSVRQLRPSPSDIGAAIVVIAVLLAGALMIGSSGCTGSVAVDQNACRLPEVVQPAQAAQALTAVDSLLWPPDYTIRVCWVEPPRERDRVNVLDGFGEWSKVANIHFEDIGSCDDQPTDVSILGHYVDAPNPTSAIGSSARGLFPSTHLDFGPQITETVRYAWIRHSALHEGGHILGFTHEANRSDSTCGLRQGTVGDRDLTPYDGKSVMDYCNGHATELSCMDKAGAVAAYGPAEGGEE